MLLLEHFFYSRLHSYRCGHCKRAKPQFVSAAAKMKKDGMAGRLAAVDCTKVGKDEKGLDDRPSDGIKTNLGNNEGRCDGMFPSRSYHILHQGSSR